MKAAQGTQWQPFVSVIIPAHNEEKWISSCLESVLKQSYPNKEIIVVDDASTDNTGQILKRFSVTVIRNEKPVGPSSARNIGVREARGEIVVFIDAHCIVDDPEWIQKFLQFFSDPKVGAVGGYFTRQFAMRRPSLTIRPPTLEQRLIKSANAAYRKTVFEEVRGFDRACEWAGDAALTYKIHRSGWKVVHAHDIAVIHAEKIWSIKRALLYGTCYFQLLKRYPQETAIRSRPVAMGLLITMGLVADFLSKLPVFTVSFMIFLVIINGAARNVSLLRMLTGGLYTTIWSLSYYIGALYGLIRTALWQNRGSSAPPT